MNEVSNEYAAALDASRVAQRAYDAAVKKYRTREIGDDEYLAARKVYNAATAAFDLAYIAEQQRNPERGQS